MFVIVLVTGAAGFFFSFLMLKAGIETMWIRYPLAVGFAYVLFLLLLRVWMALVELRARQVHIFDVVDVADLSLEILDDGIDGGDVAGGAADALDVDELGLGSIALVALAAGIIVCLYVIWIAPALFAEILVDGVLMTAIYKKIRAGERPYWVYGAVRRTWIPALLLAAFLGMAGFVMQRLVPDARSIGPVVADIVNRALS